MKYSDKKRICIANALDARGADGMWLKSYSEVTEDSYIKYSTRAVELWYRMLSRSGGANSKKHKTYSDVVNNFKSFQEFAEWCQGQEGYLSKEQNGRYWQLDKDLLFKGNREYSPETCLFVPSYINALCISGSSKESGLPLGVTHYNRTGKYVCIMSLYGKPTRVGLFETPEEAHKAWQKSKMEVFLKYSADTTLPSKLVGALLKNASLLRQDIELKRETLAVNRTPKPEKAKRTPKSASTKAPQEITEK